MGLQNGGFYGQEVFISFGLTVYENGKQGISATSWEFTDIFCSVRVYYRMWQKESSDFQLGK